MAEDMNQYIFLDPDGTRGIGLLVVIAAPTGVTYAHQCGGLAAEIREIEGFMVPLGVPDTANALCQFFRQRFRGNPPQSDVPNGPQWSETDLRDLSDIVATIPLWHTKQSNSDEFQQTHLQLDTSQLAELTEAWIPVITVYGPGILMCDNSD